METTRQLVNKGNLFSGNEVFIIINGIITAGVILKNINSKEDRLTYDRLLIGIAENTLWDLALGSTPGLCRIAVVVPMEEVFISYIQAENHLASKNSSVNYYDWSLHNIRDMRIPYDEQFTYLNDLLFR